MSNISFFNVYIGVVTASIFENIHFLSIKIHSKQQNPNNVPLYIKFTITYFSDILIIAIFITMVFSSSSSNVNQNSKFLRHIFIPFIYMITLVLVSIQTTNLRGGLWRILCETPIMTIIGYASYPIYLLQVVLLNFYTRMLYNLFTTDSTSSIYDIQNFPGFWFGFQPWWWKLIGVICLIGICWPIQRYFQDGFVSGLYSKIMIQINMKTRLLENNKNKLNRINTPMRSADL